MDDKPKRRWYQFSLTTMFVAVFVVSIPLAWVGYSLNWIRERRAWKPKNRHRFAVNLRAMRETRSAPGGLWLFGEQEVQALQVYGDDRADELDRIKRLFPEAVIWARE